MDMETTFLLLCCFIGVHVVFMPAKELREAYSPSARPSCFVSGAYLLDSLRQEIQIWCVDASWDDGVSSTTFRSL